jgi:hypothetical protein
VRRLEFQPVRIGSQESLLPRRAELLTIDRDGKEWNNETVFSNCCEYTAQSVIRFDVADAEAGQSVRHTAEITPSALPDVFEARLELESTVDSDTSAVGDPITARLLQSIAGNRGFEIPRGAILRGRIKRLDVTDGRRYADFAFTSFEWGGKRLDLRRRENQLVTSTRQITGTHRTGPGNWSPQSPTEETTRSSGPIRAYDTHIVLRRGFQFILESRAAALLIRWHLGMSV